MKLYHPKYGTILSHLNLNMPTMRFFDFHLWDICFRVMILDNSIIKQSLTHFRTYKVR